MKIHLPLSFSGFFPFFHPNPVKTAVLAPSIVYFYAFIVHILLILRISIAFTGA